MILFGMARTAKERKAKRKSRIPVHCAQYAAPAKFADPLPGQTTDQIGIRKIS
jgi:hypothetical protein